MPHPKDCRCWCSTIARIGGQAGASARIENYLGFPTGISGAALAGRAYSQAQKFGAEVAIPLEVKYLDCGGPARRPNDPLRLELADGRSIHGRTVVVASGARYRRPNIPNVTEFEGAGVSYWASAVEAKLCEGEEVALIGGGNSAGQAVVFLAPKVKHIHLGVRRGLEATMSRYLVDRIAALPNVSVHTGVEVVALEGDQTGVLCNATFRGLDSGKFWTYPLRHLFLFIGADPNGDWLAKRVAVDNKGFVITGRDSRRPMCRSTARRCRWKRASRACSRSATCGRDRPSASALRSARARPSSRRFTRRWRISRGPARPAERRRRRSKTASPD